jgi:hypothetical protein
MASLVTLTGLPVNSLIQVKAMAMNSRGWALQYSDLNTVGATIETIPT